MAAHEDVILPWYQIVLVYLSYTFIIVLGYINEFLSRVFAPKTRPPKVIAALLNITIKMQDHLFYQLTAFRSSLTI